MGAYSSLPAHEGTRLEAILTWSSPGPRRRRCGAALGASIRQRIRAERGARAGIRTLRPGGLGGPSAPTTRGCLRWLDEEETKGGESLPGRQGVKSPASCSPPGSTGPGTQIAANWSAGWRARRKTRTAARRTLTKDAPFGAPAPHFFRRGARKRGPARGRHKNTGDDARPEYVGRIDG